MSGNILDVLSKPAAADPDFYNKGLQNLNALRDTQAKQAIADITQQAVDPQTGRVDPAKFNLLISQNPRAAWGGLAAMQAQGTAQGQQGVGQQEEVAGHRARLSQMYGIMAPLAAKGGPISLSDIQNAANQAHLSPTEAAQIGQDVNAEGGGDPNHDYSGWLKGRMTSNLTSQEQIARTTPNYQFHNIGGRLVPVDMNANTNPNPGSLITTLSPGEATQIVRVDMGDGTTQQMPLSDAVTQLSKNPAMRILGPTTGGGGSGTTDPVSALPKPQALQAIVQRESGGQNIPNRQGPGGTPASTASGYYQMLDNTWLEGAALAGIKNPPPRAMNASRADQDAAASALYDKYGTAPWAASAPGARTAASAPAPAASTPPPGPPAGPPGVTMGQVGDKTVPAPPGGAPGPYTGGGIGAALAPGGGGNPVVVRGTPLPAGRLSGDVGAMMQGVQLAQANPLQQSSGAMVAGPGAPTGNNALAGPSVELPPQPGWGSAVGKYSGGPGAPAAAPVARPAVTPAPVPAPVQPPAATPPPAPTIGRSAPLGTAERVTADVGAYTRDSGAVGTHQNSINTLQNAYRALQLADTGPGTQNLQAARAFLQSFGIATSATGDQATQWAEAHKYLMDYARTQAGMGNTDLQAQLAQGSNASTDIPKPAALAVVRNNIAKERMAMAQVLEAQGSTGYVDHTKTFLPSQDLRAYQADIMPPQELKQIEALQKTNPKAFEKFQKSLDIARAHGLISDEDLAAQNQRIRALGP